MVPKTQKSKKTQNIIETEKNINCVIAGQNLRYALRPEVSTTSGSGFFVMAQTDRQTDRQTDGHDNSMTLPAPRAELVNMQIEFKR